MKKKKKGIQISDKVWLLISLLAALLLWYCLSLGAQDRPQLPLYRQGRPPPWAP